MTHAISVNCMPRTSQKQYFFPSRYMHIFPFGHWFPSCYTKSAIHWSDLWTDKVVYVQRKKKFLARSDHSLRIQKIRTPGIERHQHYSNCLDRNKYNRCICAIRGYDMSLSLWSFILKKIGSALRLLTCFRSKGFYKDQPCSVKNVGHLLYYSHLKGM